MPIVTNAQVLPQMSVLAAIQASICNCSHLAVLVDSAFRNRIIQSPKLKFMSSQEILSHNQKFLK